LTATVGVDIIKSGLNLQKKNVGSVTNVSIIASFTFYCSLFVGFSFYIKPDIKSLHAYQQTEHNRKQQYSQAPISADSVSAVSVMWFYLGPVKNMEN
jgi:Tfp pilus assembly protein PilO